MSLGLIVGTVVLVVAVITGVIGMLMDRSGR